MGAAHLQYVQYILTKLKKRKKNFSSQSGEEYLLMLDF